MATGAPIQLNAAALGLMSAAEVSRARAEGHCADLLAGKDVPGTPAVLAAAFRAGGVPGQGSLDRAVAPLVSAGEAPEPLTQLSADDLDGMSASAIVAAKAAGQCDVLLGRAPKP